jgi:hypothetical protein
LVLADDKENVTLRAPTGASHIADTDRLSVIGRPFDSEAEAMEAGTRWRCILTRAFAGLNIGADFGERAVTGAFTEFGLRELTEQHGGRFLNDAHGLMAFECEPWPRFASASAEVSVGRPEAAVLEAVANAVGEATTMSDRDRLAYDLYSASFSQPSADARFVMLMMAVETLLNPRARPPDVVEHVEGLIAATRQSDLPKNEKDSLVGSLRYQLLQSIGQAGRELATRLGDRQYMGDDPPRFFGKCYDLRSRLVHGGYPRPSRGDVDQHAAELELFVANLLSADLPPEG